MSLFKEINVGALIQIKVVEKKIDISRICSFFKLEEEKINEMYTSESIESDLLLKWSRFLEYDFFRIYSQHLVLYSPPSGEIYNTSKKIIKSELPTFKKHLYTREIIDFIVDLAENGIKTKKEIMETYRIPKTTLNRWIAKYGKSK
nr:transposase [uncultured Chryseobacterium sp.]